MNGSIRFDHSRVIRISGSVDLDFRWQSWEWAFIDGLGQVTHAAFFEFTHPLARHAVFGKTFSRAGRGGVGCRGCGGIRRGAGARGAVSSGFAHGLALVWFSAGALQVVFHAESLSSDEFSR